MPTLNLFPREEDVIVPSAERKEPVLWIRRLVILPSLDASAVPIRDIEFRRGLNIVQTSPRLATDLGVIGHSVGKTLLTRLIRYSLGEPTFATKSERSRIIVHFPDAYVIAHWRVADVDWCVARPFAADRRNQPFAIQADRWPELLDNNVARRGFEEFTMAIQAACWNGLPELPNTNMDQNHWLKVLGFLTRDWQCGYRQFNDWRNADSESGVVVERAEASRILRWLMNLIDIEELPLWKKHQGLLDNQRRVNDDRKAQQQFLNAVDSELRLKLGFDAESDLMGGLFASQLTSKVETQLQQLQALGENTINDSVIVSLENEDELSRATLEELSRGLGQLEAGIEFLREQLAAKRQADETHAYATESPYENCGLAVCPLKLANRTTPECDPARQEIIESLRYEIQERLNVLANRIHERDQLQAAREDLRKRLRAERRRVEKELAGIERSIGRWESYSDDVKHWQAASKKIEWCDGELKQLGTAIKESGKVQETVRRDQRRRLNSMSNLFARVLGEIFGVPSAGKLKLTAFGLEPEVDERLAPSGAALSAMAQVLSFDLACMISSVVGLGNHPRFVVHDSPRSNDIEEQLFHQMLRVIHDWESLFAAEEASFQYTSTTSAPIDLCQPELGLVRLTLSSRTDDDSLLRVHY